MRHRLVVGVALVLGASASFVQLAGCAAEGSESRSFGPGVDLDAGRVDARSDAGIPEGGTPGKDSGTPGKDSGVPDDSGTVADTGATDSGPSSPCTAAGRIVVVAGSTSSAAGAAYGPAGWTQSPIAGMNLAAAPSVELGASGTYHVVARAANNGIYAARFDGTQFTAGVRVGTRAARDVPTLTPIGADMLLVYQDDAAYTYYFGLFSAGAWNAGEGKVQPAGGGHSFGPRAPWLGTVGADALLLQGGDAQGPLFAQTYTGGAWQTAVAVGGTNVCGTTGGGGVSPCGGAPGFIALPAGGTYDALAMHIDRDTRQITASVRKASDKTWSSQGPIRPQAPIATTDEQVSLTRAGSNRACVAFRGNDQKGYVSCADVSGATFSWSAPTALAANTLASPPRATRGACGADALFALVTGGEAKLVRMTGTNVGAAESVPGTTGATFASLASSAAP
jgi:hypothetical protein